MPTTTRDSSAFRPGGGALSVSVGRWSSIIHPLPGLSSGGWSFEKPSRHWPWSFHTSGLRRDWNLRTDREAFCEPHESHWPCAVVASSMS